MIKKIIFIFIAFISVVFIALWGYLQTPHAQRYIFSFIQQSIKDKTGHDIEIATLEFPFPFHWVAKNIELKEKNHTWLTVGEMDFYFPYWELLNKTVAFRKLSLKDVHLIKIPPSEDSSSVTENDFSLSWDIVPFNLHVSGFVIQNLTIEPEVLETLSLQYPLNVEGSLSFNTKNHFAALDLSAQKHSGSPQSSTQLRLTCQGTRHFIFRLDLCEQKEALLSQRLGLSFPEDILFTLEGYKEDVSGEYKGSLDFKFLNQGTVSPLNKKLAANFSYQPQGLLNIASIHGTLENLALTGALSLNTKDDKIHESKLDLNLADLSDLSSFLKLTYPLSGAVDLSASFSGTLTNPTVDLKIQSPHLNISQEFIEKFEGIATFTKTHGGVEGHALITGIFKDLRLKLDSLLNWNGSLIHLSTIQADYGTAKIEGDLQYHLKKMLFTGNLEAAVSDSSVFQTLLDMDLQGASAASIKFIENRDSLDETQNIEFNIELAKARYEAFRVEKALLSGNIHDAFRTPQGHLILKAQHTIYKGFSLREFTAESSIDLSTNNWPFSISANETIENGLALTSGGFWFLNRDELKIHVETLQGKIKKYPLNLPNPVTLNITEETFDLSPFTLNVGQGFLYTSIDYKPALVSTNTRIRNVPLEVFYPHDFTTPMTGNISAEASLIGRPDEFTGELQATLTNIQVHDSSYSQKAPFAATIDGRINKSAIVVSAQVNGVTPKPIEIQAELPIQTSLNPPNLNIDAQAPLKAHLLAEGEIAPLLELLVIESSSLTGKVSVELDAHGSFNDPHIKGNIAIKNGSFESSDTGAVFHHLNARLEANDQTLVLREFETKDMNDGMIRGTGVLELKRELGFPFSLQLQLSRIRILNLDFAKSIASGEATVKGTSRGAKVTGQLVTDSLQVTIPEQTSAVANSIDVKYINLQKGEVSPIFTSSQPRWPVELDVKIDASKNATIKAKSLSSHWQGGVRVNGTAHAPQLFGDFKIIKGEYDFNGKTFDIKEGTITFAGDPEKKTTLYVIASKDLGKLIAEVILKGSVKNPSIAFRSNPPMSQREILSWILFGRGATDITPFQGAELSQSVNNLAKESNKGPDVLTKIRDSIGVDRIDISKSEGNESNEVSLQVGKYISRGVFVTLNKSITSEANQVGIEANLWPNIKAEAHVGDDASTQFQLKWKRDY